MHSVEVSEINSRVASVGYYVLRSPEMVEIATAARSEYLGSFSRFVLRSGGFRYDELRLGPIRKKNISSTSGLGEAYAQVLQTIYYPRDHNIPRLPECSG